MDLKRLITQFTYRIEPKPDGGFIARPSDPTLPPLEASTRAELQQKIQANIVNALAMEFPGLKLPLENKASYVFHIETKPGGAFALHSADPNTKPLEAASHAEIQNHFAEKLMDFVGEHLTPELSKAIAASASAGNVQLFVNMKTGANVDLNSPELKIVSLQGAGSTTSMLPNSSNQENDAKLVGGNFTNPEAVGNSPITPEAGNWNFFRLLLALLVIVLAIYFFIHHH